MLVLTRRLGESIIIGNGIKLTLVSIGPGRVKIGIEAPPNVRIDREEIHTRIQNELASDVLEAVSNTASAQGDQPTLITSGPETNTLPGTGGGNAATGPDGPATPMPAPTGPRLSKFRAPRKPR
jgi:carbon storage regulator